MALFETLQITPLVLYLAGGIVAAFVLFCVPLARYWHPRRIRHRHRV